MKGRPPRKPDADFTAKILGFVAENQVSLRELARRAGLDASTVIRAVQKAAYTPKTRDKLNRIMGLTGSDAEAAFLVQKSMQLMERSDSYRDRAIAALHAALDRAASSH